MPDAPPVTFLANASGPERLRRAVWETVHAAMRPGDEALVLDGNYGPAGALRSGGATRVARIEDSSLSLGLDRILSLARTERIVLVGAGCRLGIAAFDHLRAALDVAAAAVLQRREPPTGAVEDVSHLRVLGIQLSVLRAIGGFAMNEERARRTHPGFIGVSELVELTAAEVARGGWTVAHVPLPSAAVADAGGATPSQDPVVGSDGPPVGPRAEPRTQRPSARLFPELAAVVSPAAEATVQFFSGILSEAALRAIQEVLSTRRLGDPRTDPDAGESPAEWDILQVATMLRGRGQSLYAAWLLDDVDLGRYTAAEEVAKVAAILLGAGRPLETLLERLGHALPQLVAAVVAGERRQALRLLREWWRLRPGEAILMSAVLYVAPSMELAEALEWHRAFGGTSPLSPLSQVAAAAGRTRLERATAIGLLELLGTQHGGVAKDVAPYLAEGTRRAQELLGDGAARAGRERMFA